MQEEDRKGLVGSAAPRVMRKQEGVAAHLDQLPPRPAGTRQSGRRGVDKNDA